MITRIKRKLIRKLKRQLRHKNTRIAALAIVLCVAIVSYAIYMDSRRLTANTESYKPLLHVIAEAESKGNYNAHFGNASNTSTRFTEMTIEEVLVWQASFVQQGNASSAVGRYQIIDTTLRSLVEQQGISAQQKFDEATQDQLAVALLERRGAEKYVNRELDRDEFAANLAMEWAALPRIVGPNPHASYYDGDGLNQSLVQPDKVLDAIGSIQAQ